MTDSGWFRWDGDDLVLRLRVQPKASRDEFADPWKDAYRVRITAPPVDGKANTHLRAFLAKAFGVARSAVVIESGETGRDKRVRVRSPKRLPLADMARLAGKD